MFTAIDAVFVAPANYLLTLFALAYHGVGCT
jgi:hypothetical protein